MKPKPKKPKDLKQKAFQLQLLNSLELQKFPIVIYMEHLNLSVKEAKKLHAWLDRVIGWMES